MLCLGQSIVELATYLQMPEAPPARSQRS